MTRSQDLEAQIALELELTALDREEFIGNLYRLVLRRHPEPAAIEHGASRLADATLSRAALIHDVVTSPEFERVRVVDDALTFAHWARKAGERPRDLNAPVWSDERPIEFSWCLARYRGEPRVLDVGYAYADPAYLAALVGLGAATLVGVDLAAAEVPGMDSVCADVRSLPFDTRSFDFVLCISTIEHVGADNSRYGIDVAEGGMSHALEELRRVGGRVLLTVPCGEPADYGWFIQDEPDGWRARFRAAGFVVFEDEVYELGREGWRAAPDFRPAGVRYGDRGPGASAILCAELHARSPRSVARALRRWMSLHTSRERRDRSAHRRVAHQPAGGMT